jgi:hypothetical protein
MASEETADKSPAAFLAGLGKHLLEKEGVDVGLAGILQTHLLTLSPTQDAVVKAKAAIVQLAGERANLPKTEDAHD